MAWIGGLFITQNAGDPNLNCVDAFANAVLSLDLWGFGSGFRVGPVPWILPIKYEATDTTAIVFDNGQINQTIVTDLDSLVAPVQPYIMSSTTGLNQASPQLSDQAFWESNDFTFSTTEYGLLNSGNLDFNSSGNPIIVPSSICRLGFAVCQP